MKDKHTINLILISSRWFNSFYGDYSWWINSWLQVIHLSFRSWSSYHILGSRGFIFLFGVPNFLDYIVAMLHLNHCKASPCVFNFSFFLSSFYYRSSSWRLYMVVRQGFFSFSNCTWRFLLKLRYAKLYSKINMVFNTCFVWRSSSISSSCIPKCNSFYLIFWGGVMSLLTISFMFHDSYVVKNEVF